MAPNGKIPSARIHTHAAYNASARNNEFSGIRNDKGELLTSKEKLFVREDDIGVANISCMISYVVTPNGSLQKYDNSSGKIRVLSNDMPSDKNDPNRLNDKGSEIERDSVTNGELLKIMRDILYENY